MSCKLWLSDNSDRMDAPINSLDVGDCIDQEASQVMTFVADGEELKALSWGLEFYRTTDKSVMAKRTLFDEPSPGEIDIDEETPILLDNDIYMSDFEAAAVRALLSYCALGNENDPDIRVTITTGIGKTEYYFADTAGQETPVVHRHI